MKKILRYSVVGASLFGVQVKIIDQSHFCEEFGEKKIQHDREFVASDGFTLKSHSFPTYSTTFYGMYVIGNDKSAILSLPRIEIPFKDMLAFMNAVKEYNEFEFSDIKSQAEIDFESTLIDIKLKFEKLVFLIKNNPELKFKSVEFKVKIGEVTL